MFKTQYKITGSFSISSSSLVYILSGSKASKYVYKLKTLLRQHVINNESLTAEKNLLD